MKQLAALSLRLILSSPCLAQQHRITDRPRVVEALHLLDIWVDAKRDYNDIPVVEHGGRMAVGYSITRRDGSRPAVTVFQARGIAPAAGYASTVEDLGKFASWQFRVLHHGAEEVLSRNTLREMQRVHWVDPDWDTKRGLGFGMRRVNDKTYVGHGGSCPGYRSHFSIDPAGKVATIFMTNASGVNSGIYTQRAQETVGPAIATAVEEAEADVPTQDYSAAQEYALYVGIYDRSPWGQESAAVVWKGKLAVVSLTANDPLGSMMRMEKTGEHTFRRVRDDDALGEVVRFDIGPDGRATRMWQHGNYYPRLR